jgi:Bacterial Ig domain
MRRWIAWVLITALTVSSTAPAARAQSASLIGGGLTALPQTIMGPNLVQNPGFETLGPAGWTTGSGWTQDQLTKHSGTFSYRRDTGASSSSQTVQLKAGTYTVSGWVKTQSLGSSNVGVRLTLDQRPGGVNAWTPSDIITGTNDWMQITLGPIVIAADQPVAILLENYNNPSGTAWFDDIVIQQIQPSPVDVFMLYPNFRGMLFDDQPQTVQFDVNVTPPGGDFGRYSVKAWIKDEASGQVIAQQSTPAAAHVVATVDGTTMQAGRSYLATVSLIDLSSNTSAFDYPAYRVSKVAAATRSTMNVSADAKNRILLKGVPRFVLGVYDSGLGYGTDPNWWETTLWSAGGDRRMGGMNINMYLNYWYGQAPTDAMGALMTNLQSHGVTYLQTGNCFDKYPADNGFLINSSDSYVQQLAAMPGLSGFYTADECLAGLQPGVFTQYQRLRQLAPATVTFSALLGNPDLTLWRDSVDILSTDPYPLFGAEPAGGYTLSQVADWTTRARNAVKDARPYMTVQQFFQFTSLGRFPTQAEMRNMAYMAIVEGAHGLFWWSLGDNALTVVCSGWCDQKTTYMNNLKATVNELAALEPALVADDATSALTTNSNTAIKTKVKLVGGKGYVFAYNSTNTSQNATFTWNTAPGTVTVNAENRTLGASGNSFTDTFGSYAAHVYVIGNGGTGGGGNTGGGTTPSPTPTNPTLAFTAPTANATVSNTATVTLAASGGSGSGYTYGLKVDGTAVSGTGPTFSWDTTKVANGSHTLTGAVTDSAGGSATATLAVTVSNNGTPPTTPTVTITAPAANATVSGTTTVTLSATGGNGVGFGTTYTYGLKVDGTVIAGTGPSFSWDTTKIANGAHTLTATATDPTGGVGTATRTVTVSNTTTTPPPSTGTLKVFITQPTAGTTVSSTAWAVMWLEGSTAASKTYTLSLGGKPMGSTTTASNGPVSMPYDTRMVVDGTQPLVATVRDSSNNTGSATTNVNVRNGITTSPTPVLTAAFTWPSSGATMMGTTDINMSVSGSTAVSKTFQLSVDGTVVSTQTVSGSTATYKLDTTKLSNAAHTLSLRVNDSAGGSATASMPVTVNNPVVQTPAPSPAPAGTIKVYVTQPGSGAVVSGTAWVTIWLDSAAAGNTTYTLTAGGRTVWTETNGSRPATLPWNTALNSNGTNTLTVNVTDSTGNTGSGGVSVWVAN